ncbi:Signal transducer regulating beta-lactamase production, contains metallopeptidase domain [Anaerovirgula multivorans]|uniref:Signal transducer regulating beta-lactamase production, contains metallopeptidase domain n=1 Tax=Anaerovirgula multivorans TaxID=312168 RepID=A0A239KWQ4_9FIRM|nr:extracellular solute-binding protein [Anaerovirgula multivorans]SNT22068.1 Signal transducer regulating beta-lactamase production, contains metallopeptidase domain [Anaerovirgula multivorans]
MTLLNVFYTILKISFLGSVAAIVILFVKKIFKNKISAACHYLIWIILLVRLVMPYYPESSISIYNFFTNHNYKTEEIQSPVINNMSHNYINSNNIQSGVNSSEQKHFSTDSFLIADKQQEFANKNEPNAFNLLPNQSRYTFSEYTYDSNKSRFQVPYIAAIIWLLGVCFGAVYILWLQLSYSMKIKSLSPCNNRNIIAIYEICKSKMKVNKKIPLVMDARIKTPSLLGILHPKIILSPDYVELLMEDELKFVFMHELAHYKRKDIIVRWILIFLQILHWFNPVIWFVFNIIRQDSEKACDEQVLSYIEPNEYKKYGNTMLKMLDIFSGNNSIYGAVGMINRKKFIIERVKNIVNFKKNYLLWSILGIAIFSVLAVFLLTNAKQPPQEVIKIKYEAEEIGPDIELESVSKIKLLSNEQLLTYDMENRQFIIIDDEGNRIDINCEGLPQDFPVQLFTIDSNDYIYTFVSNTEPKIYVHTLEGEKIREINLELKDVNISEENAIFRWDMKVDSKGNIYLLIPQAQQASTQVFDPEGKHIKTLKSDGYVLMVLDEEDNLYTITYKDKVYITKQNPLKDEILWEYEDDKNLSYLRTAAYSKQDQSIYLAELNNNNISKFDPESQSLNKMINMDAILSEKTQDEFNFQDFAINNDGSIYLCVYNNKDNKSYLYKVNSRKIHIEGGIKELTISVRHLSPILEYAINKFENQHPDIVINIDNHNAFSWITSDMTYEETLKTLEESAKKANDFVQKINAQMLTGKGPDILLIDSIPYRRYADKKLLLDLKELMEEDASFDKSQYYSNIFDALEYKGKLYAMPLDFSYPAFLTNTGFLKEQSIEINDKGWTWKDFIDIANRATKDIDGDGTIDMYGMPTIVPERLFQYIYNSLDKGFVDYETGKATFTSEEFIDLLKMCENISQETFVNPDISEGDMQMEGIVLYPFHIHDFSIFYSNGLINADEVSFYGYPTLNNATYNFDSGEMYGINSQTKYKEEAWEFIKYLISEEIQCYQQLYSIPINKRAREIKIEDRFADAEDMMNKYGDLYGYQVTSLDKIKKQLTDNVEKLNEILPKLNHTNMNDIQVDEIIEEEVRRFFNGERSAEETAEAIQRKVEMYFKE